MNINLIEIQKRKEEIIAASLKENQKLRQEIFELKDQLKSYKLQISQLKHSQQDEKPRIILKNSKHKHTLSAMVITREQHNIYVLDSLSKDNNYKKYLRFIDAKGLPQALGFKSFDEAISDRRYNWLDKLLSNSKMFKETIGILKDFEMDGFVSLIKGLMEDTKTLLQTIVTLKKLVVGFMSISHRCEEQKAFNKNVELICDVLSCERASIFLHNESNNTLWTVGAMGTDRIEIAANKGIAGAVFNTSKNINLNDPYSSKLFNPEVDKLTNFHTKSILCVPIFGDNGERIGICQAINSKNIMFSLDDEKLLEYLSKYAGTLLINSIEFQSKYMVQNLLRDIMKVNNYI